MHSKTKLSSKATAKKFTVGDLVTSEFFEGDRDVIREILRIEKDCDTESTVRIWASDGGLCECCSKFRSRPISGVDGAWMLPF
jgi:hypothetical protein